MEPTDNNTDNTNSIRANNGNIQQQDNHPELPRFDTEHDIQQYRTNKLHNDEAIRKIINNDFAKEMLKKKGTIKTINQAIKNIQMNMIMNKQQTKEEKEQALNWFQKQAIKLSIKKVEKDYKKFMKTQAKIIDTKKKIINCLVQLQDVIIVEENGKELTAEDFEKKSVKELDEFLQDMLKEAYKMV